jgi:DHA3 family tetracycline resistance protein-like MFS transporter
MRNRDASFIYLVLSGASSLCYSMLLTVELVYLIQVVGFNPLQLVLIGTLRQSASFLFQVPTGILADMYSRRWAVVLGILLIGTGYLIEGSFPAIPIVFAAQLFWGIGAPLADGADVAWITDEIGVEQAGPLFLRAAQIGSPASLLGIALSAVLVNIHLNLPLVLGGSLLIVLSILLVIVMPEYHFVPAQREDRNTLQQMVHTLRAGIQLVRARPILLTILGVVVFSGVFSAGFDQIWNYHLLHNFAFPALGGLTSATWFSIIEAGIVLTNFCGTSIIRRCVDTNKQRAVVVALYIMDGLTVISVLGFAIAGQFTLALIAFFLLTAARGPRQPLEQIWMNEHVESRVRATLFSLRGQVNALAQIVGGPILGAIATGSSTRIALIAAGIVLSPTLLLYICTFYKEGMEH